MGETENIVEIFDQVNVRLRAGHAIQLLLFASIDVWDKKIHWD